MLLAIASLSSQPCLVLPPVQDAEENKLEYMALFQQYTSLLESTIASSMAAAVPDFDMQVREGINVLLVLDSERNVVRVACTSSVQSQKRLVCAARSPGELTTKWWGHSTLLNHCPEGRLYVIYPKRNTYAQNASRHCYYPGDPNMLPLPQGSKYVVITWRIQTHWHCPLRLSNSRWPLLQCK